MKAKIVDNDQGFADLIERLGDARSVSVLVGIRGKRGSKLVKIAAANEFGTRKIPARSFLRATVDLNVGKYTLLLEQVADKLILGIPPDQAVGIVGAVAVGDIQRRIRDRIAPPNAAYTIAKKGSDVPLIDTGRLRQSIDYTVEIG